MTLKYSIRKTVETDLERIWFYSYREWGIEQADTYITLLVTRFAWLGDNPRAGKSRDDIKRGYYSFPEGAHVIFYTIDGKEIDIIGVPHQSMDIISYLDNMDAD